MIIVSDYLYLCVMIINRRLSKKKIAQMFGLVSPGGQIYSRALRRDYFTDDVLAELSIKDEEYRRIKLFSHTQTIKIIQLLDIDVDDLKSVGIMARRS